MARYIVALLLMSIPLEGRGAFVWMAAASQQEQPDPMQLVKDGRKLSADGKQDEALPLYRRALEIDPNLFEGHLAMGIALDLKGEYGEARQHLNRAIELATPETRTSALTALAVSYAFECRTSEVAKYYQKIFDQQMAAQALDGAAATANALGRVYLECGDPSSASKWYQTGNATARRIPNLPSDQIDLWEMRWQHALARIAARRGHVSEAKRHLATMKVLVDKGGPNAEQLPIYEYLAGYVAFYAKDYDTAIAELHKADQNDPFILGLTGQALEKKGDAAGAREYYDKVLALNAHNIQNALMRPLARRRLAVGPD